MKRKPARKSKSPTADGYSKFRTRWRHVLLIDQRIRSKTKVNCTTLAKELEVSRRTVLRDIEFLKYDLGAPLEFDPLTNGYVYTEPNWNLPNLRLTEGDLFALLVAEKALEAYAGTPWARPLQQGFDRITAGLPSRVEVAPQSLLERVNFGFDAPSTVDPEVLAVLTRAVRDNQCLRMTYFVLDRGKEKQYTLDPYVLRRARGAWYLAARDHATGHVPLFNLSRIRNIEPTGETFDYAASGFDPKTYFHDTFSVLESKDRHHVVIEFTGSAAQVVQERQWHPSQKIKIVGDKVRLEMDISSLYDVLPWVLSWGGQACVLGPPELANLVKDQATAIAKHYQRENSHD